MNRNQKVANKRRKATNKNKREEEQVDANVKQNFQMHNFH